MTQASDPLSLHDRILAATFRCVERFGMGKTTIDDIVKESGVSRATIYRQFAGGRDEVLLETVGWELTNYLTRLADHVRDAPSLADLVDASASNPPPPAFGTTITQPTPPHPAPKPAPVPPPPAGPSVPVGPVLLRDGSTLPPPNDQPVHP